MSRVLNGTVVSSKNNKTIVVSVETSKTHPIYKKKYKQTKRFQTHDENNTASVGDIVTIEECRPLSATKRFILKNIISKSGMKHIEEEQL